MIQPQKPIMVFDGDCAFCRAWIARWRWTTGDRVEYAPYQEVADHYPEIPLERFKRAVQLIDPDGASSEAAEAVFRSLAYAPGGGGLLWLYQNVPGFARVSEACYRLIAGHRDLFLRLTRWLWGSHLVPPGGTLTAWLFLRFLGVIYGIAFVSLWVQIIGLVGSDGILPARGFLQAVREHFGVIRYWDLPTLAWLSASDQFLVGLCAAGTLLSLLLVAGVAPIACLVGCWLAYLSLADICQDFLWFQWDSLLLETGFLAILIAPWRWWSRPRGERPPPRGGRWLLRWLLFRLMFSSAAVKLASGDPHWRDLTALKYHYETQPIPPWIAWYAHHLPLGFQKFSTATLFAIEGLVPFFIFAPRRIRMTAAVILAAFHVLIFITGNYCFFNLLAIALCLLALDDGVWPSGWRARVGKDLVRASPGDSAPPDSSTPRDPASQREKESHQDAAPPRQWPTWIMRPAVVALFLLSLIPLCRALRWPIAWLGPVRTVYGWVSPLRSVNSYGLFAIMTTERPEIIVEGSNDAIHWLPYEFRYKPGDVMRRPPFVAPHQPRLDWQMWFAALSDFRREPWFLYFCERLLHGSQPVLALLAKNPFPSQPPRFIRAVVYDYHFTDEATRRVTGAWWGREIRGLYCPILTLENGRLMAIPGGGWGQ